MLPPELQAAYAILKRGVSYKIPAPFFFRLLGRKNVNITITPLYHGTELMVSAILIEKGLTEKYVTETDPSAIMFNHYNDILKIVAITSLNRYAFSKLALWMRIRALKRISVWQLFELYNQVRKFSGINPFMIITRLAVETRTTKPNLGQMEAGV